MLKLLNIIFVIFGGVFLLQILFLAYVWFADPFGLRPLFESVLVTTAESPENTTSSGVEASSAVTATKADKNPNLTPAQEDALVLIGIDPAGLPDTITPEQYSCFVRVLGEARVAEIQAGGAPTPIEIFKAKECLQ